mgnify:CR=1 FL=1
MVPTSHPPPAAHRAHHLVPHYKIHGEINMKSAFRAGAGIQTFSFALNGGSLPKDRRFSAVCAVQR